MLEPQANQVMTLADWEEYWKNDDIGFHLEHVNKMLENNIDKVLNGRKGVRFFFPLCGKAVDMKWLSDRGHSVVGVEICEKAVRQFFEENNMTYSEEAAAGVPGGKLFKVGTLEENLDQNLCWTRTSTGPEPLLDQNLCWTRTSSRPEPLLDQNLL